MKWTRPGIIIILWIGATALADQVGVQQAADYMILLVGCILIYHYLIKKLIDKQ